MCLFCLKTQLINCFCILHWNVNLSPKFFKIYIDKSVLELSLKKFLDLVTLHCQFNLCIIYLLFYAAFGMKIYFSAFHLVFKHKKERYMLLKVNCLFSQENKKYGIQSILYVLAIFKWSSVTYSEVFWAYHYLQNKWS